ncbi:hypothetical protein E8A34_15535, partial [Salmonella enterica]|nr:hypothetical protein [Salmonella enterica]
MTIQIIKNSATSSISIDELVDFLRSEIDFKDTDSIQSAHHNFGRLFLNKDLIKNHILHEIKRGTTDFESINKYTPPSLILYACQDFFIRANLWRATEQYLDNDINLYGLAHDHNFD